MSDDIKVGHPLDGRAWKLNRINKVHVSARFFADDRTVSAFLPGPLSRASDSEIPATGLERRFRKRTVRFRDTRRRRSPGNRNFFAGRLYLAFGHVSMDAFLPRRVVDSARGSNHRKIRKEETRRNVTSRMKEKEKFEIHRRKKEKTGTGILFPMIGG